MAELTVVEEKALSLEEVKEVIAKVGKRDKELNPFANRAREYLDAFVSLSSKKKTEMEKKLKDLSLTRLKDEHIAKITDFLPATTNDLKVVLQAYPLSMPKKDMDAIVAVVKEYV